MKRYIIIAGPNGAGKSTLYNLSNQFPDAEYVNMDAIVRENPGKDEMRSYIKAAKIALEKINDCFLTGRSFVQESTLCGTGIMKNIHRAKDAGYKVIIHYIGLDSVEIAKKRIRHRIATGGHDVPVNLIESRFGKSMEAIKKIIPEIDEVFFYDNTEKFCHVAKYVNGKCVWTGRNIPEWYRKSIM